MLTSVNRKPAQVCAVNSVPIDAGSASSAILAENCAESAITEMPQHSATPPTSQTGASSSQPISAAHAPLTAIAPIVTVGAAKAIREYAAEPCAERAGRDRAEGQPFRCRASGSGMPAAESSPQEHGSHAHIAYSSHMWPR